MLLIRTLVPEFRAHLVCQAVLSVSSKMKDEETAAEVRGSRRRSPPHGITHRIHSYSEWDPVGGGPAVP